MGFLEMRFTGRSVFFLFSICIQSLLPSYVQASQGRSSFTRADIAIREYDRVRDKEAVVRIISETKPQLGIEGEYWASQVTNETEVSVIVVNGNVAGFIEYALFQESTVGHIFYFAIGAEYRDHGLGRRLIQFAVDRLRSLGAQTISLNAYSNNTKAINFYTKFGFSAEPTGGSCTHFVLA